MKKFIAVLLVAVLALSCFTACGSKDSAKEDKVISIAASPTPHAEILAVAKEALAAEG